MDVGRWLRCGSRSQSTINAVKIETICRSCAGVEATTSAGARVGSKDGVATSRFARDGVHVEVNGYRPVDVMLTRQPLCASWLYLHAATDIGTAVALTSLNTVTMASTSLSVNRSSGPPLARAVNGSS
jgi:hypothetical protein